MNFLLRKSCSQLLSTSRRTKCAGTQIASKHKSKLKQCSTKLYSHVQISFNAVYDVFCASIHAFVMSCNGAFWLLFAFFPFAHVRSSLLEVAWSIVHCFRGGIACSRCWLNDFIQFMWKKIIIGHEQHFFHVKFLTLLNCNSVLYCIWGKQLFSAQLSRGYSIPWFSSTCTSIWKKIFNKSDRNHRVQHIECI